MNRRPLFVYGTLCDPDLRTAVLGRAIPPQHLAEACAPGFRAVHYPGRIYPAIIRVPGTVAPGHLVFGLSRFEFDLLDAFEGEEYRRDPIPVIVDAELHEADAYLPAIAIGADAPAWSLGGWQTDHKATALAADAGTAAGLRARLIAIRPN